MKIYIWLIIILICIFLYILNQYLGENQEDFQNIDWTDKYDKMYRILDEDFLNKKDHFTEDEKREIEDYFVVEKILNEISDKRKCISCSLFCQNSNNRFANEHPTPDFHDKNGKWYQKYYSSLKQMIQEKDTILPEYKIRLYLEKQLEGFADELLSLSNHQLEIYVMKNNSIGANPGAMWRFLAYDDKNLDVVFTVDIDEPLKEKINFIESFEKSDKVFGRYMGNCKDNFYVDRKEKTAMNYAVVLASRIGYKPSQADISFKDNMIKYILHRKERCKSDKPWKEKDDDIENVYNRPIGSQYAGWGGDIHMYGFDEKIFKHVFFPYFVQKSQVLTWSSSPENILKKLDMNHPSKIDYEFTKKHNNQFIFM